MRVVIGAWLIASAPLQEAPQFSSPWRVVIAPARAAADHSKSGIRKRTPSTDASHDPRRAEAARAFADGEAAFERGDFADAAERFGRAHALAPHPWTLYNQAVSLRNAGESVGAWRAFAELASIAQTDEERAEATRERAALRDRVAIVELHGPRNAAACIDRELVRLEDDGHAQWVVGAGAHRLTTTAESRSFTARPGGTVRLEVAPARRRAPAARGWLVAAIVGSAGGLGGGVAAAVLTEHRGAKTGAAIGASAAGTALVASIVALALVERDAKRVRPQPLPCELAYLGQARNPRRRWTAAERRRAARRLSAVVAQ